MHYKKPKTQFLTPRRRRIIKPLVRRSHYTSARQFLQDPKMRKHVVDEVGRIIHQEIMTLCSESSTSILNDKSNQILKCFTWKKLVPEFEKNTPILLTLLKWCCKTRKERPNANNFIAFIVSLLCRHRRPKYSLIQRIVSLILYSGHASKKVRWHNSLGVIDFNIPFHTDLQSFKQVESMLVAYPNYQAR